MRRILKIIKMANSEGRFFTFSVFALMTRTKSSLIKDVLWGLRIQCQLTPPAVVKQRCTSSRSEDPLLIATFKTFLSTPVLRLKSHARKSKSRRAILLSDKAMR